MIPVLIFFTITSSCNFLKVSPGVLAQGLGGCSVMSDEGLSAFHNPALIGETKFNFSLARWLYGTSFAAVGAAYRGNALGITYLSYGTIHGYDETGLPTHQFSPYCLTVALARKLGPLGIILKNFQERIDSVLVLGFCGGIASYIDLGTFSAGAKIDNIGIDLTQESRLPLLVAAGLEIALSEDTEIMLESKAPTLELNSGLRYTYQNYQLLFGIKYLPSQNLEAYRFSVDDLNFSVGLIMSFDTYEIAYSFGYTQFSNSHTFAIIFTPRSF